MVRGLQPGWGKCSRTISLSCFPQALAYCKDTIAVGSDSCDIILFNAITGIHRSVLLGHVGAVRSLEFSLDGIFLVSGSNDETVNLWDIQTGCIVKTFHGHTDWVSHVSISPDSAMIASGSENGIVHLWDIKTGGCHCSVNWHNGINSLSFSPTNPQLLIFAFHNNIVQKWNTNDYKVGPAFPGSYATFSPDGTHFVLWGGMVALVQNSNSGVITAKLQVSSDDFQCCCFSPNGKLLAGGAGHTVYIWDITSFDPHLIKTFIGHTRPILSLIFSSSFISSSIDQSIKFWQIGDSLTDSIAIKPEFTPVISTSIMSISLQTDDDIAILCDKAGVVTVWNILTGLYIDSFHTPARKSTPEDMRLVDNRLILIWENQEFLFKGEKHIWDSKKGKLQKIKPTPYMRARISGDGSKVFFLNDQSIQAWSIYAGRVIGEVTYLGQVDPDSFHVVGSRVWVDCLDLQTQGWDFGATSSAPVQLPRTILGPNICHLDFTGGTTVWGTSPSTGIKGPVARKTSFQLPGMHKESTIIKWNGQYLVAGYESGEFLILDFNLITP